MQGQRAGVVQLVPHAGRCPWPPPLALEQRKRQVQGAAAAPVAGWLAHEPVVVGGALQLRAAAGNLMLGRFPGAAG